MKQILIFSFILFGCTGFGQVPIKKKNSFSIGETIQFHSDILNEDRVLNVYLPLGYSPDSAKTYPVIYLLDGSVDEDFIHIAGLVQFLSFSWLEFMPEVIVVGIVNVDRRRDFTWPTKNEQDKKDFPTTGGSEKFISSIEKEIQPLIRSTYKTGDKQTIIGQSLGGLLATEILFKNPGLFDNYLIVSPSTWWDNGSILKTVPVISGTKSIFIAVGKEGKQMITGAKKVFGMMKKAKPNKHRLYFQYYPQHDHGDVLHEAAYDGLVKIFSSKN